MKPYAVLLTTLIMAGCIASIPTPTPAKPVTSTHLPACTPTNTPTPLPTNTPTPISTSSQTPTPSAGGVVYYVTTNGDDGNPGTEAQPFRTVMHGIGAIGAGDTLYVKEGTYTEGLHAFPSGTSWETPVTIAVYPGDTVIVNGEWEGYLVYLAYCQYVVVDGFIFDGDNTSTNAIALDWGANHIRIQNSEIKNGARGAVFVREDSNEMMNLWIHHNGTTGCGHGIYIKGDDNLVDGCRIHDGAGWGVHVYASLNASGSYPDNNSVRNNIVYDNGPGNFGPGRVTGIGIYTGARNIAYNNIVWGNALGFSINYDATDTEIYNNTVYANHYYGIYIGSGHFATDPSTNAAIRNNIVYLNAGTQVYDAGIGTIIDHNLVDEDPQFVDASAHDFHLQRTSPAIDAGISLSDVRDDRDGVSRPRGVDYDIGAYEFAGHSQD